MLAAEVRSTMTPLRVVSVVERGARVRPEAVAGPTSWSSKLTVKVACPSSMPRLLGEGIEVPTLRRIPLGDSESPGKSGLTIVTPGSPLKADVVGSARVFRLDERDAHQ